MAEMTLQVALVQATQLVGLAPPSVDTDKAILIEEIMRLFSHLPSAELGLRVIRHVAENNHRTTLAAVKRSIDAILPARPIYADRQHDNLIAPSAEQAERSLKNWTTLDLKRMVNIKKKRNTFSGWIDAFQNELEKRGELK